jgi:hypothetical protein
MNRPVFVAVYVVDPKLSSAADTNAGSAVMPFKTMAKAVELAQPGDPVILRSGTYTEALALRRSGTPDRPILFQAEKRHGAVVTIPGTVLASDPGVSYITVRGIVFRDQRKDIWKCAAQARSGWRIEGCVFEGGGLDARLDNRETMACA